MADCSELSKNLMDIAMDIAGRDFIEIAGPKGEPRKFKIDNADDVVTAMQEYFPAIRRQDIVDAFVEATEKRERKVDEIQKKMQQIKREFSRGDPALKEKIDDFNEYLETGEVPVKVGRTKKETHSMRQLRQTRTALRKWIETGDPAMKAKLKKKLVELNKKIASGDVDVKPQNRGKLHQEVQAVQDEVNEAQKKIREMRAEKDLQSKITSLQKHLDEGTLPQKKTSTPETRASDDLREIVKDLRHQLRNSDPAKAERLEKSIATLEQRLKEGDILPKPKERVQESREIRDLIYRRDLLRNEIRSEVLSLAPVGFWGKTARVWDALRATMTTGEFSFALRQGGVFAYSHPVKWSKAMLASIKSFASAKSLHDTNQKIINRENGYLYQSSGLVIIQEGMSLTKTEEIMMNYWADKAPGIRNFNRAAIAFMNTMRADLFDAGYETLGQTKEMTQEEAEVWSNYINIMSGRGDLGKLEGAALKMNRMFFSARYVASRFQMITGQPLWSNSDKGSWRVRGMIAREYARLGLGFAAVLGTAMAFGFDIEPDPRSPDFLKPKLGNRRLDVLMGHQQVFRFLATILTGAVKTSAGDVKPIRPKWAFFTDEGFFDADPEVKWGGRDAMDVMAQFGRSKLSPQFGLTVDIITGKKFNGEEINLLNTAGQLGYPMTYGDIWDVMQEDGVPANIALSALAFLGMGLQTYDTSEKRRSRKIGF